MAHRRVSGERGIAKLGGRVGGSGTRGGSVGSVNEMAAWGGERGVWGSRGPERVVWWEIGGWYEWTRVMIWRMG